MAPKPTKQIETKKNILVIPSRVVTTPNSLEGGEETEIAAQISLPHEGGWGWVVVFASFWIIFVLDGIAFTFGSLHADITEDLNIDDSLVALINSIQVALYLMLGPVVSSFINRFGFRACTMTGCVLCAFSLFTSYFVTNFASLCTFLGVCTGVGFALINLSAGLIVGFYFEKLRALALSICLCGSSLGIMCFYPLNSYLVQLAGWRSTTLLHSGLFAVCYFLAMTFRPLLSLSVVKTTDTEDPTRTVTYLPSLSAAALKLSASRTTREVLAPTATERLFSAVSNANFPTAAAVVEDEGTTFKSQPGPSTATSGPVSKLTITAIGPQGGISHRHLKQVQSIISKTSVQDKAKKNIEITVNMEEPKKRGFWKKLFHWERHVPQARPMYRDDAFYHGKLENLPAYQKSVIDTPAGTRTGLEYQLAVSRAAATSDLRERRGVFTTAVRRVLATMMDPSLLKKSSFMILCLSGFCTYLGLLVPFVFVQDRNLKAGVDPVHCTFFVSAIGLSNAIGRLTFGILGCKYDPLRLYWVTTVTAGIATILSNFSYNLYYQYAYCGAFGFFISTTSCLRSVVLVSLYGLEKLTNATGMVFLFQGLATLISTPLASVIKSTFGYDVAFYVAGACIAFSGSIIIFVRPLTKKENSSPRPIKAASV